MAAGVELAAAGIAVDIYEASRTLGGRARRADIDGIALDNGQHILVGAYRETLRLMAQVGADPQALLQRQPLHLDYPNVLCISAPDWPAPLHLAAALLGAKGLTWGEKWAAIRFMQYLKGRRFVLPADITVTALMDTLRQPEKLRRYLWEPLCVATLNTPPEQASALVFANVLRDTLGAGRAASDLLLPRVDLSALLPEPAAGYIEARGGRVLRGERIGSLAQCGSHWQVDGIATEYSHVVVATAPHHLSPLLTGLPGLASLQQSLAALRYEPIVTVYLQYPPSVTLNQAMVGYGDGLLQWLFDRGRLLGTPGLMAAVISAKGRHENLNSEQLAAELHREIATLVPHIPPPLWHKAITEKRATFACTPQLSRLATTTPLPGLLLAGDHIASDYPATLESAVRSGIAAARQIITSARRR